MKNNTVNIDNIQSSEKWWNELNPQSRVELMETYYPQSLGVSRMELFNIWQSEVNPPSIQSKEEGKQDNSKVIIDRDKIKDRTMTFTHHQVEMLKDALSIAMNYHLETIGMIRKRDKESPVEYWHDKYMAFGDIANDLENGEFDI